MPRPSLLRRAVLLATVATVATGCVSINLSGTSADRGTSPLDGRREWPTPLDAGPRRPTDPTPAPGDLPGPSSGTRLPSERRVCRTSGVPRGWIVVDYVRASDECPARAGADSLATAAVLTRYGVLHHGATLEVCADQRTPRNWFVVRDETPAIDATRCLGAVRDGLPTTKLIRRLR